MLDPKQRLASIFAAAFAMGAGPQSGIGAGALSALNQQQQQHEAEARQLWQSTEQERQRQARIIEQQNAELDRQRTVNLQQTLQKFSQAATQAQTKDDYDKLADAYGQGLSAAGYRITPNWLRVNVPWQAPSRLSKIQTALSKWRSNPNNQRLLDTMPDVARKSVISVDNGVPMTLDQALEATGQGFAKDAAGNALIAPKDQAGTAAFDVKLNALTAQWTLEHPGQILDPKSKNDLIDKAIAASKEKPEPNPLDEQEKRLRIQKLQQDLAQGQAPTATDLFELTPDKPTIENGNKIDPRTGLTPNAVYQGAVTYALEGKMPSLGMGSRAQVLAARNAIQNKAGAIAQAAGVTLPDVRSQYAANRGTVAKLLPQKVATESAANTAADNLDLALQQSPNVARTGSKLVNRYTQWAQGQLTPAKGLTQFEVYIYTAAREYAKVASGSALSAQGLTDSAAKEAEKLLNAAQSPEAFAGAVDAMKHDMANVVAEKNKSLAGVSGTIASFLNGEPVQAGTTTTPTAPRVYYDMNGNPTTAPKKP